MEERIHDINPDVSVVTHRCFFLPENADEFPFEEYDYIVINDVLDDCVEQIHEIIGNEHCKASNNLEKINQFRDELTNMWKGDIR